MNTIRGIAYLSLRGYRTNRGRESARRVKPPREIEMIQPGMPVENSFDEEKDPEDLDEYAADFKNVSEYHKMHEREMEIEKSKLMTQIVKRKYFEKVEPAMLTWGEKEQIRRLHSQDPEEWTPERLGESFPASRDAVLKVLRSKWSVKSVKAVEKYEETVKKNWHLFKTGKLDIDPQLEAHLSKFKNRKFKGTDPEFIAKKIVAPKPVFPSPQSKLFSNIIQSYLDVNPDSRDDNKVDELENKEKASSMKKLEAPKSKSFKQIISDDTTVKQTSEELTVNKKLATEQKFSRGTPFTLDQFLQTHVEGVREDKMTPVDRVIVDEVKQQGTEDYKSKSLIFQSANPVDAWKRQDETKERLPKTIDSIIPESESENPKKLSRVTEQESKELAAPKIRVETSVKGQLTNIMNGSLETGIISRVKTEAAQQDDYPEFIKIPRNKYKRGVTYRVEDRYYDDDGELLYRVPGLKT